MMSASFNSTYTAASVITSREGDSKSSAPKWKTVEDSLGSDAAAELRRLATEELVHPDFIAKVMKAMTMGDEPVAEGKCLLVLGPSAAGKSHAIKAHSFDIPKNGIILDGSYVRTESELWKTYSDLALSMDLAGFSDLFDEYFKKPTRTVKDKVLATAVKNKWNLIVHDTASNYKQTLETISEVLSGGYSLSFSAVFCDPEVCEVRGSNRGSKKYSSKNWEKSVRAVGELYTELIARKVIPADEEDKPVVLSTSGYPYLLTIKQLQQRLADMSGSNTPAKKGDSPTADGMKEHHWCEVGLLAGIYRPERAEDKMGGPSDVVVEVAPRNRHDQRCPTFVSVVLDGILFHSEIMHFDVASCTLRDWNLSVAPDGRALLAASEGAAALPGVDAKVLKQTGQLEARSLPYPVHEDAELMVALGGLDFCHQELRPWTEEEFAMASEALRLAGPHRAPAREAPSALVVVAPSGSGKTTLWQQLAEYFNLCVQECVALDSSNFLRFHGQYTALLRHGQLNEGIWLRCWASAKTAMASVKSRLLTAAMAARQDLVTSDTGSDTGKLLKKIVKLKEADYVVHFAGIFADLQEIMARGKAREMHDGKRYNRDLDKLSKTFVSFSPAIQAVNGRFAIFKNPNSDPPVAEWYLEGVGSADIRFDLDTALASRTQPSVLAHKRATSWSTEATCHPPLASFMSPPNSPEIRPSNSPRLVGGSPPRLQGASLAMTMMGGGAGGALPGGFFGSSNGSVHSAGANNGGGSSSSQNNNNHINSSKGHGYPQMGGSHLANAEAAIRHWDTSEVESLHELQIQPSDVEYLGEGNANIVVGYRGSNPSLKGCALRLRKGDSTRLQADWRYSCEVIAQLFGPEYLEACSLVRLARSQVAAIDEAIFSLRPAERRKKRLTSESDPSTPSSEPILALKMTELTKTFVPKAKLLTVELKPKCGLIERRGLPSRYQMLQHWKKQNAKIDTISNYDPVKLLSRGPTDAAEGVLAALEEPQNNIRVALDGQWIFPATPSTSSSATWQAQLPSPQLPDKEALASFLGEALAGPSGPLRERLRRVQAWASGDAEKLVDQLYNFLKLHLGAEKTDAILQDVSTFQQCLADFEHCPCDETGIDAAVAAMDGLVTAASVEPWSEELQHEMQRWCCRFLLGRCANDLGLMVNVLVPGLAQQHAESEEDFVAQLIAARYKPLRGLWYRISIIDADRKSPEKIPEYASQLDTYVEAYRQRFSSSAAQGTGGHIEGIVYDGDVVWKKDQGGERGWKELSFLRWAAEDAHCRHIVPSLIGYRRTDDVGHIGMENLLAGLKLPSFVDVKMGTRTWGPNASPEKVRSQASKAKLRTTGLLGFYIVSGKYRSGEEILHVGPDVGKELKDRAEVRRFFQGFLHTESLRKSAQKGLQSVRSWWQEQDRYAFYASSLFFSYDHCLESPTCKVKMIDFTHAEAITDKSEDLSGYRFGLDQLEMMFASLVQ